MARFDAYIGLGDSISIDDYAGGRGRGAISLLYRNLDGLWPDFKGRDLLSLNPDTRLCSLAADGATTDSVLSGQVPRLPRHPGGRALVTLTVGGNDFLQAWAAHRLDAGAAGEVFEGIVRVVDAVQQQCPRCEIIVATVYDPTDGTGELADGTADRAAVTCLNRLNDRIAGLGERDGVSVADLHRHCLGHGSHHGDRHNPHHDPDDPTCWYVLDIEPNERGAHEVRRAFWDTLRTTDAAPA